MKSRFLEVYLLQAFYCLPFSIGWGFAMLFYVKLGFTFTQIIMFYLVYYLTVISMLMFLRKAKAFSLMKLSLSIIAVGFFVISRLDSVTVFNLIPVIFGLTSAMFWVPYNITYFRFTRSDSRALLSGFMFLVFPLMNTVFPFISGLIIDSFGFRMIFLISVAASLIALFYVNRISDSKTLDLYYWKTLKPAKGVRTLVYLEGVWQGIAWTSIPLITFSFINSGFGYGSFLSYLGFLGAAAALILCGMSDRLRNRTFFILPVVVLVSVFTIAGGLTYSFGGWVVVNGLISFFVAMTSPFTVSVVLDKIKDVRDGMVSRELFLNLGRATGVLVVLLCFHFFESLHYPLIAAGLAFLLYPIVLRGKKLYPSRFSVRSILSEEVYDLKET